MSNGKRIEILLDKQLLSNMFVVVANLWEEHVGQLSEIDSRFGDGDHGVTIERIARTTREHVLNWGDKSIKLFIEQLGDSILGISGGSAGPLYGTLISGFAQPLSDEKAIDGVMLKKMFQGCLDELSSITKARVNDKTMMDVVIPAVEAARNAPDCIPDILCEASKAAQQGMEHTKGIASKFGRARNYGDETIGTPDAGAVSSSLLFRGLFEGLVI